MKKILTVSLMLIFFCTLELTNLEAQALSQVVSLNESNFTKKTKSGLYLVDFYADWCRPCKMMQPVLEDVAKELKSKIIVASINTDKNPNLSSKFQISGIPCLVVLKNGKEINRYVGYHDKATLLSKLAEVIK